MDTWRRQQTFSKADVQLLSKIMKNKQMLKNIVTYSARKWIKWRKESIFQLTQFVSEIIWNAKWCILVRLFIFQKSKQNCFSYGGHIKLLRHRIAFFSKFWKETTIYAALIFKKVYISTITSLRKRKNYINN